MAPALRECGTPPWSAKPGTYIVTGANGGLGREIARALAAHAGVRLVLAVRRPEAARSLAEELGLRARVQLLDVGSLASVQAFCRSVDGPLAGLVNNAGLQSGGELRTTTEGLEETFAVNYLGALALALGLAGRLAGGRVLFIGSGTHNPAHLLARMSGFRGAQLSSLEAAARGARTSDSPRQAALDRYATSKLLCTTVAPSLAGLAAHAALGISYFTLDPGMMPGTELARGAPAVLRFAWNYLLPGLTWALPDATPPRRAGATAAWLVAGSDVPYQSGVVLGYDGTPSRQLSEQARDQPLGHSLLKQSIQMIAALGYPSIAAHA